MPNKAAAIWRLYSLFLGMFLLQIGQMLLTMGLSLKVPQLYNDGMAGVILAMFALGLIVGAIRSRDLIERIGHIRAFAAFATIMSGTVVFHALVQDPWVWLVLRLVAGLCFGGLIAIFEGWISDAAEPDARGFVVATYQFLAFFGQSFGMLLANFVDVDGTNIFLIASVVLSISLVPIVLTRVNAPTPDPFQPKGFRELFGISPLALTGAIGSGLIFGLLYSLTSIFLDRAGLESDAITYVYVAFVIGAMVFQLPLAFVADRVDRRISMLFVFVLITLASFGAMLRSNAGANDWELTAWFFVIGGGAAMVYPIALARAYDYLKPEKYVAAASAMVMAYSAAAFIGPTIGGVLMQQFGSQIYLPMLTIMALVMAIFTIYRMIKGENISVDDQEDIVFMSTRVTTSAGLSLDPRTPELTDDTNAAQTDDELAFEPEPEPETPGEVR